jgi:hypothetical protein
VVLTLVVVGGSLAVAVKLAASGEQKPATVGAPPHRARRASPRRAERNRPERAAGAPDQVPPRPGLLTRLRAGVTLLAVVAVIGGAIALGLVVGVEAAGQILEDAVN